MSPDYRSERMESAEGKGRARRAWEAYAATVTRVGGPVVDPVARRIGASMAADLMGFWLCWHLEGGFEGLRRMGMSRATIYRRVSRFRHILGVHPDEFELPGVTFDLTAYNSGGRRIGPPPQ